MKEPREEGGKAPNIKVKLTFSRPVVARSVRATPFVVGEGRRSLGIHTNPLGNHEPHTVSPFKVF